MLCNPEAKFIVWSVGNGGGGGLPVVTTLIACFCSPEGEAAGQLGCMKTMLWWKSHSQPRVRVRAKRMVNSCATCDKQLDSSTSDDTIEERAIIRGTDVRQRTV